MKQSLPGSWISTRFVASSRSAPSLCLLPDDFSLRLQTELATGPDVDHPADLQGTLNTHVTVPDPHSDVSNPGVPGDRCDVLKTDTAPGADRGPTHPHPILSDKPANDLTVASDVNHRTTKSREDDGSRYRAVSIPLTCPSLSSGSSPLT